MNKKIGLCAVALALGLLSGCDRKQAEVPPAPVPTAAPTAAEPVKATKLDVGGVSKVTREVESVGSTQELAVAAALQSAVAQVNGVRVAGQMQSLRAGLDVSQSGQSSGSVRAEAFTQKLVAATQGAVTGFEVLSQEEIDKVDEQAIATVRASDGGYSYAASASTDAKASADGKGSVDARANASMSVGGDSGQASGAMSASGSYSRSASYSDQSQVDVKRGASSYSSDAEYKKMRSYWKVRVRVDVAQYRAPEEQGRPKIVVALPKTLGPSYVVGDGRVAASEIAGAVRARLSDILTQTKRFIVLDREFGSDMQAEIDHINSGNVRVQDAARLGQQLATDLILIPTLERFEYVRSVRQLRMSDRQLVSYSGGGRMTLRLLNATTGEVVMSDSFDSQLADADPSTLPRVIDGNSMAAEMMNSLSARIGSAIVTEIFPITVVALNGDQVVLSQGGESLAEGQRWQAVYLGEELKDPQTGKSLGRNEIPLGTIRVDRVSSQTSYGTLEDGASALAAKPFTPGAIALRKRAADRSPVVASAAAETSALAKRGPSAKTTAAKTPQTPSSIVQKPAATHRDDDKW
jgi:hypothetical protein